MTVTFYIASAVAVLATLMVVTRHNPIHALLYLIVSFLSVAVVFFLLGAPFVAALEVIIYAGAIMVLFVFVVMMLNLGQEAVDKERKWLTPGMFIGPGALSAILLGMIIELLASSNSASYYSGSVDPKEIGLALFGPYVIAVELASMLLLAGLVGAFHLGHRKQPGVTK